MAWTDLLVLLSVALGQFVLIPLVGAALLFLGFRMFDGAERLTFLQSWKVYLAAVCFGMILMVIFNVAFPAAQLAFVDVRALQAGVTCLVHFLVIVVLLRRFSRPALLAQGCVVLLTTMISTAALLSAFPAP